MQGNPYSGRFAPADSMSVPHSCHCGSFVDAWTRSCVNGRPAESLGCLSESALNLEPHAGRAAPRRAAAAVKSGAPPPKV